MSKQIKIVVLSLNLLVWLVSCGFDSPSSNSSGLGQNSSDDKAVASQTLRGKVQDAAGKAVEGLNVWLYDHTQFYTFVAQTDKTGTFAFSVSKLTLDHSYSLTLLDEEHVRISSIDFSDHAGTQLLFKYSGGKSLDLGIFTLSRNAFGHIDLSQSDFSTVLVDGYLSLEDELSLDELALPETIKSLYLKQGIGSLDSHIMHDAFYLKDKNKNLYATALAESERLFFFIEMADPTPKKTDSKEQSSPKIDETPENMLKSARISKSGTWLYGSQLITSNNDYQEKLRSWQKTLFTFLRKTERSLSADVYARQRIKLNQGVLVKFFFDDLVEYSIPFFITKRVEQPIKVLGASTDGSGIALIDYEEDTVDGLFMPFSYNKKNILLRIDPPRDSKDEKIKADEKTQIDVYIHYFGGSPEKVLAKVDDKTFPSILQKDTDLSEVDTGKRKWNLKARKLTFVLDPVKTKDMDYYDLSVDAGMLLLEKSTKQDVSKVRLTVVYSDSKIQTSTFVWVKK